MEITIKWTVDSKSDEEAKKKVKALFNAAYGDMAASKDMQPDMDKIRDEFWHENYIGKLKEKIDRLKMDLQNRDDEIQDLKLENDRLKKRDEIMYHFLQSVRCKGLFCNKCDLQSDEGCYWLTNPSCGKMWDMIDNVFKKLEDL